MKLPMTRNIYKYLTIGMAILWVAGFIWVATPASFWYEFTNNQPHELQDVPEAWTVHTYQDGGVQEATYFTGQSDCDLYLDNHHTDNASASIHLILECDEEYPAFIHEGNTGRHINTEPTEFEFDRELVDECIVDIRYHTESHQDAENISIRLGCTINAPN